MGWILAIALVATGCRQLLGIDSPLLADATTDAAGDATSDAPSDAPADAAMWACGIEPPAPKSMVTEISMGGDGSYMLDVHTITINGGSQLATVTAGTFVSYKFDYTLDDMSCTGDCSDQIEIGFVPGNRVGCPFDGVVDKVNGAIGSSSNTFTAPMTPGVYDVRVNLGENFSCMANGATSWWPAGIAPPASLTIATLCVQ